MKHSACDTRSPEKIRLEAELAEQVAAYEASKGPVQTSQIRETTKADMKPATFTIQKRR